MLRINVHGGNRVAGSGGCVSRKPRIVRLVLLRDVIVRVDPVVVSNRRPFGRAPEQLGMGGAVPDASVRVKSDAIE